MTRCARWLQVTDIDHVVITQFGLQGHQRQPAVLTLGPRQHGIVAKDFEAFQVARGSALRAHPGARVLATGMIDF